MCRGAAERGGNLSGLGVTVSDPFTGSAFPGNVIPGAPDLAARAAGAGAVSGGESHRRRRNYLGQPQLSTDDTQGTVRVDHKLSASDQLMARATAAAATDLFEPYTEGTGVTDGFGDFVNDRTWNTHGAAPAPVRRGAVNSLRFGANGSRATCSPRITRPTSAPPGASTG